MNRIIVAVMTAVMLIFGTAANAAKRHDPEDTDGRLDIVLIKVSGDKGELGHFTLRTEDPWRCSLLKRSKDTSLKWLFDDARDRDRDLVGKFLCINSKLIFRLHGPDTGNRYEDISVGRPNRRTAKIDVPLDLVEFQANHAGAAAKSRDNEAPACDSPCKDRAPDSGTLKIY
jgi:hypothetical protein